MTQTHDAAAWRVPLPDKLYGRAAESAALHAAFERVSRGAGEILLIPGASGVGKTALVGAARGLIQERNGLFCQGKFDQYQQETPYFALRQALGELWRQLRDEPVSRQDLWHDALDQAVGECGALVLELAPAFAALLGPRPPPPEIAPQEARHRFGAVLRRFLAVFSRPEHPLVLFLDDWQWADRASLDLLGQLHIGTELRYLLLIVAYRDHEVDDSHPFTATLRELTQQQVPPRSLPLAPLGVADVRAFVCDALPPAVNDPDALANILWQRTQGNPFFLRAFLTFARDAGLLAPVPDDSGWQWSPAAFQHAALPDDIVALFSRRLRALPPASRELLARAACLGNCFALETLAQVTGQDPARCLAGLQPVLERGWLLAAAEEFRFAHDRIQQAAYGLIDPARLPEVRLEIGRLLLTPGADALPAERLFAAVDHLNAGRAWLTDTNERERLIEWNLHAARKAYAATAYRAALRFHRAAGAFLATSAETARLWRTRPALALALQVVAWQPKWPPFLWLWIPLNLCVTALSEELVFRGWLQTALVRRYRAPAGIALGALLFGAAHAPFSPTFALVAGVAGLGYGLAFHLGRRLWLAVALHFALNLLHLLLLSYPLKLG